MKQVILMLAFVALTGCSSQNETAAGITEFVKACDGPVRGAILLSTFSNSLTLQCDRFKPAIEGQVRQKGASE